MENQGLYYLGKRVHNGFQNQGKSDNVTKDDKSNVEKTRKICKFRRPRLSKVNKSLNRRLEF